MYKKKIRLQNIMRQYLNHNIIYWSTPGIHIEDKNIPQNAEPINTFVFRKVNTDSFSVGTSCSVEGVQCPVRTIIAKDCTLKELRNKFPNLFKLYGKLHYYQ